MFQIPKNETDTALDAEIIKLLSELKNDSDKTSQDYATRMEHLVKLHELRQKSKISKDTVANIVAHVLGLVVILQHERAHVIASKAFGFLKKII